MFLLRPLGSHISNCKHGRVGMSLVYVALNNSFIKPSCPCFLSSLTSLQSLVREEKVKKETGKAVMSPFLEVI